MKKWHGRNKSNKQRKTAILYKNTSNFNTKQFSDIPIIFYCKKCKSDFINEGKLNNHPCK